MTMHRSLLVMDALGALGLLVGLPALLDPDEVRARLGIAESPQMVYILRIVGTMLAALGLILFVFATTYWLSGSI